MGTTPNKAFPYPEDTGRVMDGADAVQQLAVAVDSTLATPDTWHVVGAAGEPAYVNGWGWATFGAFPDLRYSKDAAGRVEIRGAIRDNAAGAAAGQTVFTLPLGYRPATRVQVFGTHTGSQPALHTVDVYPDGRVVCTRTSGSDPGGTGYNLHVGFTVLA